MLLSIATMFGQLCVGEGMLLACEKDGFKVGEVITSDIGEQAGDKSGGSSRNEILSVSLDNLLSVQDKLEISRPLENTQA